MSTIAVNEAPSLDYIDVSRIRANKEALRDVDRKKPEYIELADAVRKQGVMNPIVVRKLQDTETGEEYFGLIDGLQRLTAARDAGHTDIPAQIVFANEFDVLTKQLIGNAARVITTPVEYSKQLQRMLQMNPTMTCADLGSMISQSDTWVKERLKLTGLTPECGKLVDDGVINISNAFCLAKLPVDEQENFKQQAQTMVNAEFAPLVVQRLTEITKAKREGRSNEPAVFAAVAYLRKLNDVKAESDTSKVGADYIAKNRITSPEEAWALAVKWCLSLDPVSVDAQKKKWEEIQKAANEKREKAKLEREKRKADAADTKAVRAKLQLKLTEEGKSDEAIEAELKAFDEAHKKAEEAAVAKSE